MDKNLCLYEYEEILAGRKTSFSAAFSSKTNSNENKEAVGVIWRYAVEHLLKWTPEEAAANMTDEIVEMLCLNRTFIGVGYNPLTEYKSDYRFILQYAFPGVIKYDFKQQTIDEYERTAKKGKYEGSKKDFKFPKKFFVGTEGIDRSHILMNYVCNLYLSDMTSSELYEFFANEEKAKKWINSMHLELALKLIYKDPLDFYHESAPATKRNDLLYYNYRVKHLYDKYKENLEKEESPVD